MPLKSCTWWGWIGILLCFNPWCCEADVPEESLKGGGNLIMFKVKPISYLDKWYGRLPFWYFIWDWWICKGSTYDWKVGTLSSLWWANFWCLLDGLEAPEFAFPLIFTCLRGGASWRWLWFLKFACPWNAAFPCLSKCFPFSGAKVFLDWDGLVWWNCFWCLTPNYHQK